MARKRKTIPSEFEELLKTGDLDSLKKVLKDCEVDAYYNDYSKRTALAFDLCPDELAKWLIDQGADINKTNIYGRTPLHSRASSCWQGSIKGLLELGANVEICSDDGNTALHAAAGQSHCLKNTRLLLEYGAKTDVKNDDGLNVLEFSLQRCRSADIIRMSEIAELLLKHETKGISKIVQLLLKKNTKVTKKMRKYVKNIGEDFEFYRNDYDKKSVAETSKAVVKLNKLFQVPTAAKRVPYDNKSEIQITKKNWKKQHTELWKMLVPGLGYASTAQGEVIRISGRIVDETERNGGVNWDVEYKKMGKAYLKLISSGESLSLKKLNKAKSILSSAEKREDKSQLLSKYAVKWVIKNTTPIKMVKPDYKR